MSRKERRLKKQEDATTAKADVLRARSTLMSVMEPFIGKPTFSTELPRVIERLEKPRLVSDPDWIQAKQKFAKFATEADAAAKDRARLAAPPVPLSQRRKVYVEYINSPDWWAVRNRIFSKRGRRCEACGKNRGQVHVHHLTYANLRNENDMDLLALCPACHAKRHGK